MVVQQDVLSRRLARYLREKTHGKLRLLSLEAVSGKIVIRCRADAYYPVQLAIAALLLLTADKSRTPSSNCTPALPVVL